MVAETHPPANIQSREEQREYVKKWYDKQVKPEQTWYLVDMKWFRRWKEYVSYEFSISFSNNAQEPGPIDNKGIMDDEGNLRDKPHQTEGVDIEVLPSEIWDYLVKIYTVEQGQNSLQCPVVNVGSFSPSYQVEIYPIRVYLAHYETPTQGDLTKISRSWTVQSLMDRMKKKFNIDPAVETRLYSSYLSSSYEHMGKLTERLDRYQLNHDQFIIISEKVKGSWPEINPYKNTSGVFKSTTRSYGSLTTNSATKPAKSTSETTLSSMTYQSSSYNTRSSNGSGSSYSSFKEPSYEPGLCGLSNLGNTCFMNSALQCMSNCSELKDYFHDGKRWKKEINTDNPLGMGGEMAGNFADLLHSMWDGKHGHTNPSGFKRAVGRYAPRFSGYAQQDSQELMAFLLDGLHEDLNRIQDKPAVPPRQSHGEPDETVAEESWKDYLRRNDSIIVDLFHGQLKSRLECPNESCRRVSVTFDPFCYLSLPLPIKTTKNVEVTYFSLDRSEIPLKMRVKVPKKGIIANLCSAVGEIVSKSPEQLCAAEVYQQKFHKIYEGRNSIPHDIDRDVIHVFEVDKAPEKVSVAVYYRVYSGNARLSTVFGTPTILSLPRLVDSEQHLYEIIRPNLNQYIDEDEEKKIIYAHSDENQLNTNPFVQADDPMEGGVSDEKMEECTTPKPETPLQPIFKMTPINGHGSTEKFKTSDDGQIELSDRGYLAIDFEKSVKLKVLVDGKMSISPKEHESLSERNETNKNLKLSDCLKKFSEKEQLDETNTWYCSQCEEHVQAFKTMDIWNTPKYLVVQLKRFQHSKWSREKIDTFIEYPVRDLDMSTYIKAKNQELTRYNLIAVSNHFGGLGGGHYTAYGKNHKLNRWYYFDDSSVSSADESQVVSRNGYILIYERQPAQSTSAEPEIPPEGAAEVDEQSLL